MYSLIIIFTALSCVEEIMPLNGQFSDKPYRLGISKEVLHLGANENLSEQLVVFSNKTPWEITGMPEWLYVSTRKGEADGVIIVTASENTSPNESRTAVIQFRSTTEKYQFSKVITVTQSRAEVYFNVDKSSLSFAPQAVSETVTVNSNVEWYAEGSSWITLSKTDAATLTVSVDENISSETLRGTIYLRRKDTQETLAVINVAQSAGDITGSTETIVFAASGETKSLDITADVSWSVSASDNYWIKVTPESGDGGDVKLEITALANSSTDSRSGYIYVKIGDVQKLAVPVSQDGVSLDVLSSLVDFSATGDSEQKIKVLSNTKWVVESSPEWLTVTPSQGSGTLDVSLKAQENKSMNSRSGTLRISVDGVSLYKDITVVQRGYDVAMNDISLEYSWEKSSQEVRIDVPGSWKAVTSDSWIKLSQYDGNGNGTILVEVSSNDEEDGRSGTITVTSEARTFEISVVQKGQYLKINSTAGEVGFTGGSVNFSITTSVGAATSIEYTGEAKDWLTVGKNDNGSYTLTAAYNPSANNREAVFVIKPTMSTTNAACTSGVMFNVTQEGRSLSTNVGEIKMFISGGTSDTYTITADGEYTVAKPDEDEWYVLQHDVESRTFYVIVSENTTKEDRRSQIVVSLANLPEGEEHNIVVSVVQYGEYNGHEYVDLGLPSGLKWATCNVGANSPEEYGGYYAWGETEEKSNYEWSTYKWCNGSQNTMTKYCTNSDYGTVDNKTVLEPEDDVAHVKWGGSWRMPTIEEQRELLNNCDWEWTTLNDVNGYRVTGPNGNSIFLPAAGFRYGTGVHYRVKNGNYWSSSSRSEYSYSAYYLNFYDGGYFWSTSLRFNGYSVRPVCGDVLVEPDVTYMVSVSSENNGTVYIKDENSTSASVNEGSEVTVVAVPDENYDFIGWFVGDGEEPVSTDVSYTFTVSENVSLVAKFNKWPLVSISSGTNGSVSFENSAETSLFVQSGSEVTVIATPDENYDFIGWFVGDSAEPISIDIEYKFTVSENVSLIAKFATVIDGHAYVDLGLPSGLKWAVCNVGANSPEEYGGFYAWGETEEKSNYEWSTYKWCNGSENSMTKYCTNSSYGTVDNKTVLDPEDDVAHVKWGGSWRMPTKAELEELYNNCTWTWTAQNGVNGYRVTGPNGNSIFLPAAGYRYNYGTDVHNRGYYGIYWSSSLNSDYSYRAYYLNSRDSGCDWGYSLPRYYGHSVRPVWGNVLVEPDNGDDTNSDYYVAHGADVNVTHYAHYPKSVGIMGTNASQQQLDGIATAPLCAAYFDKTETVFEAKRNETVTPLISINGIWMHGYIFVDWDNSKQFEVNLEGNGPYTAGEGNELMSWSYYDGESAEGDDGWNSAGTLIRGGNDRNTLSMPAFKIPSNIPNGEYRMRFVIQWNSIDPSGSYDNFLSDGGSIIDVTLKINGVVRKNNINGHEYIDLGLPSGIKWATCNVGANSPEEYGGYYAWGETEEKLNYSWETYKWCNGSENTMTKYCTDSDYGTVDNNTVLDPEDDVAHVKWGGSWRMPTSAEQDELRNKCSWTWTTQNGVNGYRVTGPNGNSIFLPAAGDRYGTFVNLRGDNGVYCSSSLISYNSSLAYVLSFYDVNFDWENYYRKFGLSVRPVSE